MVPVTTTAPTRHQERKSREGGGRMDSGEEVWRSGGWEGDRAEPGGGPKAEGQRHRVSSQAVKTGHVRGLYLFWSRQGLDLSSACHHRRRRRQCRRRRHIYAWSCWGCCSSPGTWRCPRRHEGRASGGQGQCPSGTGARLALPEDAVQAVDLLIGATRGFFPLSFLRGQGLWGLD